MPECWVGKRLEGTGAVKFRDHYSPVSEGPRGKKRQPLASPRRTKPQPPPPPSPQPARRGMEGCSLKDSPPLCKVLKGKTRERWPPEERLPRWWGR